MRTGPCLLKEWFNPLIVSSSISMTSSRARSDYRCFKSGMYQCDLNASEANVSYSVQNPRWDTHQSLLKGSSFCLTKTCFQLISPKLRENEIRIFHTWIYINSVLEVYGPTLVCWIIFPTQANPCQWRQWKIIKVALRYLL